VPLISDWLFSFLIGYFISSTLQVFPLAPIQTGTKTMENPDPSNTPVLLIAEDSVQIRALEGALSEQSLDFIKADSAEKGLRLAGERLFALIILDMDMPGVDGFEMVLRIRETSASRATPILFISAIKPRESDLNRGYHLGIVDYLYAPLDTRSLNSKLKVITRIYREALTIREQARDLEKSVSERNVRLKESEESFRLMVENAQDYAIFLLDIEGRISSWNPGAQRLLGYSEGEILGKHVSIIFTPEDLAAGMAEKEIQTARRDGKALDERWHVRKDGNHFWASGILSAAMDDKGELRGFVKIMRDFTERENAREQLRQSEERYRSLVAEIQDYAIFMLDPMGNIVSWNKGSERIIGYRPEEIVGRHFSILYTEEDLAKEKPANEMESALEHGRNKEVGWRLRKDGSFFWGEEIITPIRNQDGTLTGFTKVTRDITAQKQLDEARGTHVKYLEGMGELTRVLEQNLEMKQVLQMAVEKVLELFQGDRAFLVHPMDPSLPALHVAYLAEKPECKGLVKGREILLDDFHKAFARDLLATSDPVVVDPGVSIPWVDDVCARAAIAIRPRNGKPWALGIHRCASPMSWGPDELRLLKDVAIRLTDVLDNLILHRNLRASENRFRWLVENTTEIVWRFDMKAAVGTGISEDDQLESMYREAYLAECNDALARKFGKTSAKEIIGAPLDRFFPRDDAAFVDHLRAFIRSGYRSLDSESMERDGEGRARYSLNNMVGILEDGVLTGVWGTSRDITDRKMAEEEVRRSRDQLDVILQGIADAILVYSPAGSLVYFNQAASRMMDLPSPDTVRDSLRGALAEDALERMEIMDEAGRPMPPEKMPVRMALRGMESPPTLLRYRMGARGPERWLITRAKPILDHAGKVRMVISIAQDTTELRKTEEQFRQSQKMEAIGRLAGGVAHDFNNLLTAINGYSELLLSMTEKEDPRRSHIEEIRKAGERAASLTNQLLVYSRRQIVSAKTISINTVVSQMEVMLRRLIGEDIELNVNLKPNLDAIKADPGQIEQVILNLAVNARDAMPKGGRLTLETAQIVLGAEPKSIAEAPAPGQYIRLTVADSGVGMEESVKSHLFEPFFTTKKTGRGTGLGLSTVYGIVRQSGGHITVESERGVGTTFGVFFPAVSAKGPEHVAAEPEPQESVSAGTETILVVEDDQAVRNLVKDILIAQGYQILQAGNGIEALEIARGFEGRIHLLLTDVVMAQMGGRDLVDAMKLIRPEVRHVYMSGYTDDAVIRHGVLVKNENFIQKPFSPSNLARKVREVLDMVAA
jgi:two-component system, cell cycle sensor histidine kinase and response regulator CckA